MNNKNDIRMNLLKSMLIHRQNCLCVSIDSSKDQRFSVERFFSICPYLKEWAKQNNRNQIEPNVILTVIFTSSIVNKWFDVGKLEIPNSNYSTHILCIYSPLLESFSLSIGHIDDIGLFGELETNQYLTGLSKIFTALRIQNIILCDLYPFKRDSFYKSLVKLKSSSIIPISICILKGLNVHAITDIDTETNASNEASVYYKSTLQLNCCVEVKNITFTSFIFLQRSSIPYVKIQFQRIWEDVSGIYNMFSNKIGNETMWELISKTHCLESVKTKGIITSDLIISEVANDLKYAKTLFGDVEFGLLIPNWKDNLSQQLYKCGKIIPNNQWEKIWKETIVASFPNYIIKQIKDYENKLKKFNII